MSVYQSIEIVVVLDNRDPMPISSIFHQLLSLVFRVLHSTVVQSRRARPVGSPAKARPTVLPPGTD
ncbi:hypothetical protein ANCCAN_24818 [Ancylostoma caninum]|uniref:Uncharacterized protein n=1 Tax=Ancylostoma caninum TaxID=29170 RepID=A0A368FBC8_ANCCA|nr:hypothetical protein ANCCAN_24818 [Ancylostoma caninum]